MSTFTAKSDHKVMELLGVVELRHLVAHTNKGELTLMIRKGESKYKLVLDAVPLDADTNKELMDILFPEKKIEIPQVKKGFIIDIDDKIIDHDGKEINPHLEQKYLDIIDMKKSPVPKSTDILTVKPKAKSGVAKITNK